MLLSHADWSVIGLSLEVGLLATATSLPAAVAVAWLLSRMQFIGKSWLDALVHAPLVLPPVAVGYVLLVLFGSQGPLGHWLFAHWGIRFVFTTKGAVLASAVMAFPLMVRGIRLSLDSMDRGLELAARTLGASTTDVFWTISLPLMLPGILSGSIVGFARALGEFGATITFASNIEGQTRTLPLAIYTAIEGVDGDATALRLVIVSMILALGALMISTWLEARVHAFLGRGERA